ncbi:hypothetical protein CEY16_13760 [Halalkalibacillus sediminis]|uniref:Uncharacterized protein n=1 Tax=Halalkalibacillus sediminis TaxID=2018042 RepID=A0A2I0QRB9_9BACI|nr:hypothetical protein [Halalkalibacillus sediminis]PKR76873.1 hypothetical protein CEY16_13760 [Halalkalibacillus sediminis]
MKKLMLCGLLFLLSIMLLAGCAFSEEHVFEGESDNWEGDLTVSKSGGVTTEDFVLTYKGDLEELADIGRLQYSFEYLGASTGYTLNFDGEGPSEKEFTNSASGAEEISISEEEVVEVSVEWGEHEEQMVLRSE